MNTARILAGDCMVTLQELPEKSVHCCVTSPPYFGLRDYGIPPTEWPAMEYVPMVGLPPVSVPAMTCCLGLEPSPIEYIGHLVAVFREVKRVLADNGNCWLNLGDSFCNTNGYARAQASYQRKGRNDAPANTRNLDALHAAGFKTKDLMGIPWRAAYALQADGYYLRSDIIWSKPNPMPESVTDRPTRGHENLFLLAKSEKYYYDAASIAETSSAGVKNKRTVWEICAKPYTEAHFAVFPADLIKPCIRAGCPIGGTVLDPFGGSGTTGSVAISEGRNAILCEINPEYIKIGEKRILSTPHTLFTEGF